MRRLSLFLLLLVLVSVEIMPAEKVGTSGAQFLKLGAGARANGMGGAFIGMADDVYAAYWNPAGLARISSRSVGFSQLAWIAGLDHDFLSVALKTRRNGVFALSVTQLGTDDMLLTTTQNQVGTSEYFTYRDLAVAISWAKFLTNSFSFGLTVKYVEEQIYIHYARALTFDIGTQYKTGFNSLTFSIVITNFGQDLQFNGNYLNTEVVKGTTTMLSEERDFAKFPFPLKFAIGITYDLVDSKLIKSRLAMDVIHMNDYSERIHFGIENWIFNSVALRLGNKWNYEQEGFTWGLGYKANIKSDGTGLTVDYAYSNFGVFQATTTISLGLSF